MQDIRLIHTELIPSTNTALKQLAADGAPEGILLIADAQSGGYGRLSRSFFSPPQTGLYMSLLIRPPFDIRFASHLTPLAAVCCARAIEAVAGVSVAIKWVNDILLDEKKVAGILVEAVPARDGTRLDYAVIGVGVNLFPPDGGFPPNIAKTATAVFPAHRRPEFSKLRDAVALRFAGELASFYDRIPDVPHLEEYRRRSFLLGKRVTVFDALTDREKQGIGTPALATAITDDFGLFVTYEDGRTDVLRTGEVTLGM